MPQPAFKAGEPWQPHGGKVRLLRRSVLVRARTPHPGGGSPSFVTARKDRAGEERSRRLRELPSVDRLATSVARAELEERRARAARGRAPGGEHRGRDLLARCARAPAPFAAARAQRHRRDRAHEPRARSAGARRTRRGARPPARATATSSSTSRAASAARAATTSSRLAARAHRRAGRAGGQQLRRRGAARRRRARRRRARAGRLARAADRDRRLLPHPRGGRAGRRAPGRGGHDQPHPPLATTSARSGPTPARCCARTRRTSARSGSSSEVEIEELCELRRAGDRRRRLGRARRGDRAALRRAAGAALAARGGRARVLLRRQAARRPAGRDHARHRATAVDAAARHPLARALRIDKLSLAALAATLALYRDPELARREIPVLAMLDQQRAGARAARAGARQGHRREASCRASRGSAAARCRCSSCTGPRWRSTPARASVEELAARAARRRAGGRRAHPRGAAPARPAHAHRRRGRRGRARRTRRARVSERDPHRRAAPHGRHRRARRPWQERARRRAHAGARTDRLREERERGHDDRARLRAAAPARAGARCR